MRPESGPTIVLFIREYPFERRYHLLAYYLHPHAAYSQRIRHLYDPGLFIENQWAYEHNSFLGSVFRAWNVSSRQLVS